MEKFMSQHEILATALPPGTHYTIHVYPAIRFRGKEMRLAPISTRCIIPSRKYALLTIKRWQSICDHIFWKSWWILTTFTYLETRINALCKWALILVNLFFWFTVYWIKFIARKKCHFIFDYNYRISLSIFILFHRWKQERILYNAIQFTYLIAWWRHVTSQDSLTLVFMLKLTILSLNINFW